MKEFEDRVLAWVLFLNYASEDLAMKFINAVNEREGERIKVYDVSYTTRFKHLYGSGIRRGGGC
jgi:hypothetical protein